MNGFNRQFDSDLALAILEKAAMAIGILIVTWALAKAAKWAFAKLVDNVSFFSRETSSGTSLGESLGKIVSLLIWLFGLLAILSVLELGAVAGPINTLLENVMDFIPNLVGAGLIFFIGVMVARIVRDLVVTFLQTLDLDKWANRGGVDSVTGNSAISKTIGTIVYVLIIIPVAIAALDALDIAAISDPASNMLTIILNAIPNIIGAAILLGIGYLISRFVVQIIGEVLPGLGVDRSIAATGLVSEGTSVSNIIARIVQVAIILFFAIAATRMLGFPELTAILDEVLELGARVVFGAVVIGFGFLIANLLAKLVSGADGSSTAGTVVRWATIVLFTFMGLSYTGVGDIITETAFSAIVIGIAVAGALAFGLGGREWAGRQLEKWEGSEGGAGTTRTTGPTDNDPLPPGA
ncbi:mechanosensitive ion channel [Alteriqipengyuania sp. WL0013]|uniref:mechanosensitive ion channel n=1 Tax=Alteriqipengyuania sp. WL0013 TaxID=3110773 RepID=UPI002CF93E90|nr:mechanosensitive ion channel [Alteriqipengyuania sp. WL0013]MEB3416663.1 mechanosensitive ion channel [Alteriqipengyuania sp. WL0013]